MSEYPGSILSSTCDSCFLLMHMLGGVSLWPKWLQHCQALVIADMSQQEKSTPSWSRFPGSSDIRKQSFRVKIRTAKKCGWYLKDKTYRKWLGQRVQPVKTTQTTGNQDWKDLSQGCSKILDDLVLCDEEFWSATRKRKKKILLSEF